MLAWLLSAEAFPVPTQILHQPVVHFAQDGVISYSPANEHDSEHTVLQKALNTAHQEDLSQFGGSGGGPWFWQNPYPAAYQRLSAIAFAGQQTGMAVGSAILRTEDGGKTWIPRPESGELPLELLDADLNDVSLVDASTATVVGQLSSELGGAALIVKTDDGGATWVVQDPGSPEYRLNSVSFADAQHGVVVGTSMNPKSGGAPLILRTTDGGITWSEMPHPISDSFGLLDSVVHVDDETIAAVGTVLKIEDGELAGERPVFLYTTNGGVTWGARLFDPLGPDGGGFVDITFADPEVGVIVGTGGTILRTVDGGVTWISQRVWDAEVSLGGVSCSDVHTCVAVGLRHLETDGGVQALILRTTDGGVTWVPFSLPLQSALTEVAFANSTTVLAVARGSVSTITESGALMRSTDAGLTWMNQAHDAVHEKVKYRESWQRFGFNAVTLNASGIAVAGGGFLGTPYCAGDQPLSGGILHFGNDGSPWQDVSPSPMPSVEDITFYDGEVGLAVGCGGSIWRTEDGGSTWSPSDSGTPKQLFAVHFLALDVAIAVGGRAQLGSTWGPVILKSVDGGVTWAEQPLPPDPPVCCFYDVDFTTADTGFAVANDGWMAITSDAGDTWDWFDSQVGANLYDIDFVNSMTGFAVGGSGLFKLDEPVKVFRTHDGGGSWEDVTPDFLDGRLGRIREVVALDELSWMAVGELAIAEGSEQWYGVGVVVRSTDGGETWSFDEIQPPNVWNGFAGVAFWDSQTGIVVGRSAHSNALVMRTIGRATFPLSVHPSGVLMCRPEGEPVEVTSTIALGTVGGYNGAIDLTVTGLPEGVISELESDVVDAPGSTGWALTIGTNVSLGRHVIDVTATDGVDEHQADFWLDVVAPAQPVVLIAPATGAIDVEVRPTFTWDAIEDVDTYRIQVATDATFDNVVIDQEVAGTSFTPTSDLEAVTDYFWRVYGFHGCAGAWSDTFEFTTETQPAAEISPGVLEFELIAGEGDSDGLSIANVGTGDLVWTIETGQSPTAVGNVRVGESMSGDPSVALKDGADVGSGAAALVNLASVLEAQLPSLSLTNPAGGVVDCDNEPGIIIHDDGTVENVYSGNPDTVTEVGFVDLFTPSAYPASFSSVCVAFTTDGPTSLDFEIMMFDDDGPGSSPGTELGALPVSADGLPGDGAGPVWFSYDISSLGVVIDSGSVYIGVRYAPSSPNVFLAADESPANPPGFAGGYFWTDADGVWAPIESAISNYRSLFVRAVEGPPTGCPDPTTVPWLSVTPDSGTTAAGSSTPVEVAVDTTGLDSGEYIANLCVATNDHNPAHSLIVVPVHLTVHGSELSFNPQNVDVGDVEGGASSLPETVVLGSFGALDATGITFEILGDDGFAADTSGCGTTLPIGGQCSVSVTFTPVALGPAEAVLEAHSDDGAIATVELVGNGIPATVAFTPLGVDVDHEPIISDANHVFEPGELVPVAPIWRNDGLFVQILEGAASDFNGPEGPTYSLLAAEADYGEVDSGAVGDCQTSGLCYEMDIGPSGVERPATHWDATFDEVLSDETVKTWTLHIGDSFLDVPRANPFYPAVETLLHSGVTGGCTNSEYCPTGPNTRAQMPVFVLKALEGADYTPPACDAGTQVFSDVPHTSPFCPWIEELANRNLIAGCGGGNYCPNAPVTRAQMAIFLLKTFEGGGYTPPECTGAFTDVACPSLFAAWIEELADRNVTSGCSADPPAYCPAAPVTRAQMAVFVTKTFGLELYGP